MVDISGRSQLGRPESGIKPQIFQGRLAGNRASLFRSENLSPSFVFLAAVVGILAMAGTIAGLYQATQVDFPGWWKVGLAVCIMAVSTAFPANLRVGKYRILYNCMDVGFVLCFYILPSPWLTVPVTLGVLVGQLGNFGRDNLKALYNISSAIVAATVASFASLAYIPVNTYESLTQLVLGLIIAGLFFWLLGDVLVTVALAAVERMSLYAVLRAEWGTSQLLPVINILAGCALAALMQWRPESLLLLPFVLWALRASSTSSVRTGSQRRTWKALEAAIADLNKLDRDLVVESIIENSLELFNCNIAEISLTERDQTSYRVVGEYMLESPQEIRLNRDGRCPPREQASIIVPLKFGETVLGELCLYSANEFVLSEQETQALSTYSAAASAALLNSQLHAQAVYDASHDSLTHLANRRYLLEKAEHEINEALASGGNLSLILIDLDRFKDINDTLGHSAGDGVLQYVADRLRSCVRAQDIVARLGGDEFAILLPGRDADSAESLASRLSTILNQPATVDGLMLAAGGSIGIATVPQDATGVVELLRCADVAMYQAKALGNSVRRYDICRDSSTVEQLSLEPQLREALTVTDGQDEQIVVYFQPQIDIVSGIGVGAEALARWKHPEYGLLGPEAFVPIIERSVISGTFTQLILTKSLQARNYWLNNLGIDIRIAVNLSARDLLDKSLVSTVRSLLREHGVPAESLVLEIPETVIIGALDEAVGILAELHGLGIQLSLDDFGTGGAPLALLAKVPLDEIKIDRSFIQGMMSSRVSRTIVKTTIDLAHSLGLRVIAEGIETVTQRDIVQRYGCNAIQGFHCDPALSMVEAGRSLKEAAASSGYTSVIDLRQMRQRQS